MQELWIEWLQRGGVLRWRLAVALVLIEAGLVWLRKSQLGGLEQIA